MCVCMCVCVEYACVHVLNTTCKGLNIQRASNLFTYYLAVWEGCAHARKGMHMCKRELSLRVPSSIPFHLVFLRQDDSLNMVLTVLARVASQPAARMHLSPCPSDGTKDKH